MEDIQETFHLGRAESQLLVKRLASFFKQRDHLFYPACVSSLLLLSCTCHTMVPLTRAVSALYSLASKRPPVIMGSGNIVS